MRCTCSVLLDWYGSVFAGEFIVFRVLSLRRPDHSLLQISIIIVVADRDMQTFVVQTLLFAGSWKCCGDGVGWVRVRVRVKLVKCV